MGQERSLKSVVLRDAEEEESPKDGSARIIFQCRPGLSRAVSSRLTAVATHRSDLRRISASSRAGQTGPLTRPPVSWRIGHLNLCRSPTPRRRQLSGRRSSNILPVNARSRTICRPIAIEWGAFYRSYALTVHNLSDGGNKLTGRHLTRPQRYGLERSIVGPVRFWNSRHYGGPFLPGFRRNCTEQRFMNSLSRSNARNAANRHNTQITAPPIHFEMDVSAAADICSRQLGCAV